MMRSIEERNLFDKVKWWYLHRKDLKQLKILDIKLNYINDIYFKGEPLTADTFSKRLILLTRKDYSFSDVFLENLIGHTKIGVTLEDAALVLRNKIYGVVEDD